MLNVFKISLHLLHIKIKRERTRRLEHFGFSFCHFKMTFSTLRKETYEMYQPRGEANSLRHQAEAGKRCHSPSQVI